MFFQPLATLFNVLCFRMIHTHKLWLLVLLFSASSAQAVTNSTLTLSASGPNVLVQWARSTSGPVTGYEASVVGPGVNSTLQTGDTIVTLGSGTHTFTFHERVFYNGSTTPGHDAAITRSITISGQGFAPTNVSVTPTTLTCTGNQVTINWSTVFYSRYAVESRSRPIGGSWPIEWNRLAQGLTALSYAVTPLADAREYEFRVSAASLSPGGEYLVWRNSPVVSKAPCTAPASSATPFDALPSLVTEAEIQSTDSAGVINGKFRVNEAGAATYSVPITAAPGTAGVTPRLDLAYSSQSGNGVLGRGWNLVGLAAISRCRQTLMQDLQALPISWGNKDRFCLNGTRLVLASAGAYGDPNTEYKTEVDTFVKVIAKGGTAGKPDYFLMEAKDGSVTRFGDAADHLSETKVYDASGNVQNDKVVSWNISRFEDSAQNGINFIYAATKDYHRINRIDYAFGSTASAGASIEFQYEPRPDPINHFLAGYRLSNIHRLKRVIAKNGTAEIRRYILNYELVPNIETATKVSRVISMDECVLSKCLPRTEFTWSGYGTHASTNSKATDHDINIYSAALLASDFADIDGNGVSEPVWISDTTGRYVRYRIDGTDYSVSGSGAGTGPQPQLRVVDYNLDGRDDIFAYDSTGAKWLLFLSTPQATIGSNGQVQWRLQKANHTFPFTDKHVQFIDYNSDGLQDAYSLSAAGTDRVLRIYKGERSGQPITSNTFYRFSSTYVQVVLPNSSFSNDDPFAWGDFNGDGRADIAHRHMVWDSGLNRAVGRGIHILQSTATGGFAQVSTLAASYNTDTLRILDINGDGLSDIAYLIPDTTNGWIYQLSNGNGFQPRVQVAASFMEASAQFADLNSDGYPDVFWRSGPQIFFKTWIAETQQFSSTAIFRSSLPWGDNAGIGYGFRDLDNNGALDLVGTAAGVNFSGGGRGIRTEHSSAGTTQFIGVIRNGLGAETKIVYSPLNGLVDPQLYSTYDGIQVFDSTIEVCTGGYAIPVSSGGYTPIECHEEAAYSVDPAEFYRQVNDPYAYLPDDTQILRPQEVAPVREFKGGVTVVAKAFTSAPLVDNPDFMAGVRYGYGLNLIQAAGRGALGFRELSTEDLQSGVITRSRYRQDWPFIGQPLTTVAIVSEDLNNKLKEAINHSEIFGYTSNMANTLSQSGSAALGSIQVYASHLVDLEYNLSVGGFYQGEMIRETVTTLLPDASGNIAETEITKSDPDGNYYRLQTVNSYGTTDWYREKGRLTKSVVTHERYSAMEGTSDTVVREAQFTYYTTGKQNGLLRTEISNANDTTRKATTTHFYDELGNEVFSTVTGGDGVKRISGNTVYDASGRYANTTFSLFSITESDDTGSTATSSANYITQRNNQLGSSAASIQLTKQVVTRHDLGLPTETTQYMGTNTTGTETATTVKIAYTPFGNPYFAADGTGSFSLTTADTGPGYHCPYTAAFHTRTRVAGGGESVTCHDKIGRRIRQASNSFQGDWLYVDTEYDTRGRISRVSEPSKSSPYFWTSFSYDLLNRVTYKGHADSSVTRIDYVGLSTRTFNDQMQWRAEFRNAAGDLIQAKDDHQNTIHYIYTGDGQLKEMTGPSGYPTTIQYDVVGRKIGMVDPDKGSWKYKYNSLNELICQQDAKGQITVTSYDFAGRTIRRIDRVNNGTNCDNPTGSVQSSAGWKYDTAASGRGKLELEWSGDINASEGTSDYRKVLTYDNWGRPSTVKTTMLGHNNVSGDHWEKIVYDQFSRPWKAWDAARSSSNFTQNGIENVYDAYGYPYLIRDAHNTATKYYEVKAVDERGNITGDELGTGVIRRQADFYDDTGRVERMTARDMLNRELQNLFLEWDTIGNLETRQETGINKSEVSRNLWESFGYDDLNRLTDYSVVSGTSSSTTVQYNELGNITSKTGVGNYDYNTNDVRPHAVKKAGSYTYNYDNNGSLTSDGRGRVFTYAVGDQVSKITKSGRVTDFFYDANRSRYKRVDTNGGSKTTTLYLGGVEKVFHSDNTQEWRRYVHDGVMITQVLNSSGAVTATNTQFLLKDHLGSPSVITDGSGIIKELLAFDPWGKRRAEADWQPLALSAIQSNWFVATKPETSRGFTGHQMVDEMEIIHMNGRIYDPLLGRFLQADPFVQAPSITGSLNRYSYALNNPLNATDPTGFFFKSLWKEIRPYVGAIVAIVFDFYCACGTILAGMVGGAAGAAANGTSVLKGTVFGAFSAVAGMGSPWVAAIYGGAAAYMNGGAFGRGFVAAGIGAYGGMNSQGGPSPQGFVTSAVLGGVATEVTGGKFKNGAASAAFMYAVSAGVESGLKRDEASITNNTLDAKIDLSAADAAAIEALAVANPKSIKANKEYGGLIYRLKGKYFFTDAIVGSGDTLTSAQLLSLHDALPEGALAIGEYHTHGDYSTRSRITGRPVRTSDPSGDAYNSNNFSPSDRARYHQIYDGIRNHNPNISGLNWMGYLGTPSGVFKAYNTAEAKEYGIYAP